MRAVLVLWQPAFIWIAIVNVDPELGHFHEQLIKNLRQKG